MRFYASPDSIFFDTRLIHIKDREEIHHIRDVMRLKKGDSVDIFDGTGREFSGRIDNVDKTSVIITIQEAISFRDKRPVTITLYQAIPKKDKMELIIEKAVELGVDRIVPIITERTIRRLKNSDDTKIQRWSKIALSASKQSGRIELPLIQDIKDFNSALIEAKHNDVVIFAALDKDAHPLREILKDSKPKHIAVFIGPEGDFTKHEISSARKEGCKIISLGDLVLKSETAAIYILSCLIYEYS